MKVKAGTPDYSMVSFWIKYKKNRKEIRYTEYVTSDISSVVYTDKR